MHRSLIEEDSGHSAGTGALLQAVIGRKTIHISVSVRRRLNGQMVLMRALHGFYAME
jgi:hypothetical protein